MRGLLSLDRLWPRNLRIIIVNDQEVLFTQENVVFPDNFFLLRCRGNSELLGRGFFLMLSGWIGM